MFFERCCHILFRRIQEKFESFFPWKNIKKLQSLSDLEQKVCLILSYQPPSCQKEIFQQTSMEILKIFEPLTHCEKWFCISISLQQLTCLEKKKSTDNISFWRNFVYSCCSHFEQKLCVRGFCISIFRFQGNKLKKSFRGFKKFILFWKLIERNLAGLLIFSASKFSEPILVKIFKILEKCECFSLLTRKSSDFCCHICILRNRRNILVEIILVEEFSEKLCF